MINNTLLLSVPHSLVRLNIHYTEIYFNINIPMDDISIIPFFFYSTQFLCGLVYGLGVWSVLEGTVLHKPFATYL